MKKLLLLLAFSSLTAAAPTTISPIPQVKLVWHKSEEDGIAGYRVHLGQSSREYTEIIDVGLGVEVPNETFVDKDWYGEEDIGKTFIKHPHAFILPSFGKWYAAVTVYDTYGLESEYSNEVSTDRNQPPSPNGPTIIE